MSGDDGIKAPFPRKAVVRHYLAGAFSTLAGALDFMNIINMIEKLYTHGFTASQTLTKACGYQHGVRGVSIYGQIVFSDGSLF